MCFTEPEWKFLNDKNHEVSKFYELPRIHKSKIIESVIRATVFKNQAKLELLYTDPLKFFSFLGIMLVLSE